MGKSKNKYYRYTQEKLLDRIDTMESNKDEAIRCIEISKKYKTNKEYYQAWKFALKSIKLFPMSENKSLMVDLNSLAEKLKQKSSKRKESDSNNTNSNSGKGTSSNTSNNNSTSEPVNKKYNHGNPKSTSKMFKEMNKDESYRCIEKAETYLKLSQFDKAEKFLLKSKKLFPLPKAEELVDKLKLLKEELNKPKYTQEQAEIVKKLKNSKTYYTMLSIEKTATENEIKKAYKKLALLVHPDKNAAPGAKEVFVDVGNAVKTLCNSAQRNIYDSNIEQSSNSTTNKGTQRKRNPRKSKSSRRSRRSQTYSTHNYYSENPQHAEYHFNDYSYDDNYDYYNSYEDYIDDYTFDYDYYGAFDFCLNKTTMEVNKDEAYRCLDRADYYLSEGNVEKAEKFINKSKKLFPTLEAEELLRKLKVQKSKNYSSANTNKADEAKSKRPKNTPPGSPKGEKNQPSYTKAQQDIVKRIKQCKDFYDVLKIPKDATDTDIKKAYKKLALLLHPDKNNAPGAAEAFKTVGNAVATLTDPEKRKRYDMVGHEQHGTSDHMHRTFDHGFESDITAEQLFNMFFNGAFPTRQGPMSNPYYTRSYSRRWPPESDNDNHNQQQESSSIYFQLLPILLLLLLSLFSNFSYDPVYSLKPSSKYSVLRHTSYRDITYYVKDNFHTDYTGDLRRLENTIEEDYINAVRSKCIREKEYYESLMWRARFNDDASLFNQASKYQMRSCEEYQELMKKKYK
ncbi:RING finger protein PFF0165c-like [Adelges cooleyi]|uniref:RING finger protein PFF0165c-like n=1 Tax=Adelges cooleyi TaxID=133065 RepID=UPI0021809365|nr:RING finger protein PFF0165c-like [Adelges cooleyi]